MGIRCDFNRSACGLVAAAILLSPAFAASQPRLVEVPEDGWDTSAEWQGVDDVEVEVDWPPGLPPGVAAAGVSTLLYCILCEQGYTGAVSITSTIRAQASDWRESTQTVTLSCGEGETSDPDPDPDPDGYNFRQLALVERLSSPDAARMALRRALVRPGDAFADLRRGS